MMPKILILFCGGTLVMEEDGDGTLIVPPKEQAIRNLLSIEPKLNHVAELQVAYIDNIDSTNINPGHWDMMADVIANAYAQFDGFVITHGTDTMAYSASALSYILQNLGKPVILTGAQIPGGKIETDARRNLINAIRVAKEDIAGVVIVFDEEIILGSRASKVSESRLKAFESINWDVLGEIRIDIRLRDDRRRRHHGKLVVKKGFESNIAVITLVPGLPVSVVKNILISGIKGLVLIGFGTGNIPYPYLEAIGMAKELKIPVVVTTQCREGATMMHLYDVGRQALKLGAIEAYDMSLESLVTKLMWALQHSESYDEIKTIMHTNFTGEINKERKIY